MHGPEGFIAIGAAHRIGRRHRNISRGSYCEEIYGSSAETLQPRQLTPEEAKFWDDVAVITGRVIPVVLSVFVALHARQIGHAGQRALDIITDIPRNVASWMIYPNYPRVLSEKSSCLYIDRYNGDVAPAQQAQLERRQREAREWVDIEGFSTPQEMIATASEEGRGSGTSVYRMGDTYVFDTYAVRCPLDSPAGMTRFEVPAGDIDGIIVRNGQETLVDDIEKAARGDLGKP